MGTLVRTDYDQLDAYECPDCEKDDDCCEDSCLADLIVGDCSLIDWTTGNTVANNFYDGFCLLDNINSISTESIWAIREKTRPLRCGPPRRLRGRFDFEITLDVDRCQIDPANCLIRSGCPIAVAWVPKYNNFNPALGLFDQPTEVVWGRFIHDNVSDTYEDDSCQTFSTTLRTDGCVWKTDCEAIQFANLGLKNNQEAAQEQKAA